MAGRSPANAVAPALTVGLTVGISIVRTCCGLCLLWDTVRPADSGAPLLCDGAHIACRFPSHCRRCGSCASTCAASSRRTPTWRSCWSTLGSSSRPHRCRTERCASPHPLGRRHCHCCCRRHCCRLSPWCAAAAEGAAAPNCLHAPEAGAAVVQLLVPAGLLPMGGLHGQPRSVCRSATPARARLTGWLRALRVLRALWLDKG